jgi:hypothetical protein
MINGIKPVNTNANVSLISLIAGAVSIGCVLY